MENLKKVIEQTEEQISQAERKRQTAEVEQFAELDREILRMKLHLKRLKESEHFQEFQKKGQAPTDTFTQAKLHNMEIMDQLSNELVDMNGSDPRLIAAFRVQAADFFPCRADGSCRKRLTLLCRLDHRLQILPCPAGIFQRIRICYDFFRIPRRRCICKQRFKVLYLAVRTKAADSGS